MFRIVNGGPGEKGVRKHLPECVETCVRALFLDDQYMRFISVNLDLLCFGRSHFFLCQLPSAATSYLSIIQESGFPAFSGADHESLHAPFAPLRLVITMK
jgi:hypothetical protein